jgi:hypothetical protein
MYRISAIGCCKVFPFSIFVLRCCTKIKAVVLGTFAIKIESVKCKEFMRYFPCYRRNDEGVAKQAISIPNSERKREIREEGKESERRRPRDVVFIYPHGG